MKKVGILKITHDMYVDQKKKGSNGDVDGTLLNASQSMKEILSHISSAIQGFTPYEVKKLFEAITDEVFLFCNF